MAIMSLTQSTTRSNGGNDRPVLPTDMYRMKIIDAKIEDDKWAKPNKDGSQPEVIALTFEISTLTEEQQEAADEAEQDWSEVRMWKRFNPYYGTVKAGGPSKFKEFIDNLIEWKLLIIPDMNLFDIETLAGIELKCSVEKYKKQMGENAGQWGNKITTFAPVRRASKGKNVPEPVSVQEDDDLPFDA